MVAKRYRFKINKMLHSEDDYLKALSKYSDLENKKWLLKYFEMYKSTLIWPPGLPPISRTNLIAGTLRTKFHSYYRETLEEFSYKLDNENQTLEIL
jgi:hypothetical protein